jgi:LacI family transcriptional regulator, galactose operon repressor
VAAKPEAGVKRAVNASGRATMRDVARHAGVSLKTVSRVINDEPGVAEATAARIETAIAELHFQRNDLARSLRQGRSSHTLGLIIEDVANPFYSAITQAVEATARERDYLLITASAREDPERERELVLALMRRRVDALLLVPAGPDHRYVARQGTPMVFLDRPAGRVGADTVLLDNAGGARQAVEHLLEHGHERIACIADDAALYTARERLAGYRAALHAAGIEPDGELERLGNRTAHQAEAAVRELLALPRQRRPTALFTANNRNTIGALRALGTAGKLALVGFDDFELADLLRTSVVRSDPFRMGAEAAKLAFGRLDGDGARPRRRTIPTELIERGSGER